MTSTAHLSADLEQFCTREGLPFQSADELLAEDGLTTSQRAWLKAFCERWDRVAADSAATSSSEQTRAP